MRIPGLRALLDGKGATGNPAAKVPAEAQSVAGGLYNSAAVLGDLRVNEFAAVSLQSRQGSAVVAAHEEGIAHHIG
jgi:hypothetical protein